MVRKWRSRASLQVLIGDQLKTAKALGSEVPPMLLGRDKHRCLLAILELFWDMVGCGSIASFWLSVGYFQSTPISRRSLTREQAELFHAQAPDWQLAADAHRIGRELPVSQFPLGRLLSFQISAN
jgi:hypothetical protein